ncbi:MAG: antibiotic biosynthesis monooxygenase [Gammaproteobacteria bacterium]|jgi:heme-degrading monooxygenase HmoA|nr:antibiotic biosynthesis monooxygenase [Gammaproteobacteria bacterium]
MSELADTPKPPFYAVIFTSMRRQADEQAYQETAARMLILAARQPGFLGVDSARSDGVGITVSYWESEDAIHAWKLQVEHSEAQRRGRESWYSQYSLRIARVERAYDFQAGT